MRLITTLTGVSALLIAGCAAFFSVTGLGLLFSGATTQVVIMATALEIGKLVAASYLHNYWKSTNQIMKVYLIIGIITLITITSAGIFGFLSNAYTQTQINVNQVESKITLFETKKERSMVDIPRWESRIQTLSENRTRQEIRYDSLVARNNWTNAKKTTDIIQESNAEIAVLNSRIDGARVLSDSLDQLIFNTQQENVDVTREIGGFRFVAQAFGSDTDTVVKWFTLILIFVFDPLAVMLVIAFNNAVAVDKQNELTNKATDNDANNRYEVYNERDLATNNQTIDIDKHDEIIEEIKNRTDYEKHDGTNDEIVGLKIKTSGGSVVLKEKYRSELESKGIEYVEVKK